MSKYEAIFVHSAGAIEGKPVSHGAVRADSAIAIYKKDEAAMLAAVGEPMDAYHNYISKKAGIHISEIPTIGGNSQLQQVFNVRDFSAERKIRKAVASTNYWNTRRLGMLYKVIMPSVDVRILSSPDSRDYESVMKDAEREKIAYFVDMAKLAFPERIARSDSTVSPFRYFATLLAEKGTFRKA